MAVINAGDLTYKSLGYANADAYKKQFGYTGTGAYGGFADQNQMNKYLSAYSNDIASRSSFLNDQQNTNGAAYNEYAANPYSFQGNTPFMTAAQKAAQNAAKSAVTASQVQTVNPTKVNTSSSSTVNSLIPKVGTADLPSYLPANNNSQIAELTAFMKNLPGYFDTSGLEKAYDTQIAFNENLGRQTATNASREFITRQGQQGGDTSLGGLVRAQALLPVLQQSADITGKKEAAKLDASSALAKITGDAAAQAGQLRTSYLNTLADYTSNLQQLSTNATLEQQKQAEQTRQFGLGLDLDQSKLDLARAAQKTQQDQGQQALNQQQMALLDKLGLLKSNNGSNKQVTANWIPQYFNTYGSAAM